jgi:HMG (high mobility group) box
MDPEEKEAWEKMARKDKARYEVEKSLYKGPWKVPANKRTPKDPTAPKRPMSAFLAFSNKRRAALKRENPDATNADLSKMLSKTWKEAPDDLRKKYMDEEADLRAKYKICMAAWRKKVAEEKRQEREEREAVAMKHAEDQQNDLQLQQQQSQQQQQQSQQQLQQPQIDVSQQAVDPSQLFYPYMAQMGNLFASAGGGMANNSGDPSQQYANMLAANNFAQQQFSLPQQQQLLSQLFSTFLLSRLVCATRRMLTITSFIDAQQFKYPNMNGVAGMYPGLQGQFAFQGQQQQQMNPQGMQGMSSQNQSLAMQQQQAAQNFAIQQQQLQQQLAMAAMQQQQQQPIMDHQQQQQQQQQQQEAQMMMDSAVQQQQYAMQYQDGDDEHHDDGDDDDDDDEDQDSVKDDDTPPYGVSL